MPIHYDVNACLEAAMRANPNASREFLTRALSQTLTKANEDQPVTQAQVDGYFDGARARVGTAYRGAPLHASPAARLQGKPPTIHSCAYVKTQGGSGDEDVQASDLGTDLEFALRARGGLEVGSLFIVTKGADQSYQKTSGSLTVRVEVDEEGELSVVDVLENEPGKDAKVRKAFAGLSLPKDSIRPGAYDLQINFADPAAPEGRS
ncbi:MAG TPA: hypothetical protein VFX30_07165 [bacterium]|nr:hypothetical protein [bacterium]